MLLDLKNPARVLARSKEPILEPEVWYENEGWKTGVVYPCGAVLISDHLLVYYGGADKVTCVASAKLNTILNHLGGGQEVVRAAGTPSPAAVGIQPTVSLKEKRIVAYCMKCREKTEMKNPRAMTLKNNRPAVQGRCNRCGTKMFRIMKA